MIERIPFMLRFSKPETAFFSNLLVSWNQSSFTKSRVRHSRESGNPEAFEFPGFRVALQPKADPPLAEAPSLPGMTVELCNELQNSTSCACHAS
jgi:hypothetical protein